MKKTITRRDFLKESSRIAAVSGLGGCGILMKGCRSKEEFDLIVRNGRIYDGSGETAFIADIGIKGGTVAKIGKISGSKGVLVLDAKDLAVCPGFIDAHDHTDIGLLVNPKAESSVRQGITTLVSGNCGSSPFPIPDASFEESREELKEAYDLDLNWRDIHGFFSRLEESGMAVNYATLVGQGTIRGAVVGFHDRPPEADELEKMKSLVEENIRGGAIGLSSGLEYAPSSYAKADEIVELCRTAAANGGLYATHMRDESDYLIEALDEAIDVSRRTGIRLQISHFKVAYPRNWHKIDEALVKIETAAKEGIDLFCDRYPYTAGATGLSSMNFPLWAKQGTADEFLARLRDRSLEKKFRVFLAEREKKLGSWDKIVISSVHTEKNRKFEGKSISEGAAEAGKDVFEFIRDLLIEEEDRVGQVIFMMSEDNLKRILSHPLVGVGCDGSALAAYGSLSRGKPHPRSYGTFPRVLGKYVREEKILPMQEMVKKMTAVPASNFGFAQRGMLKPGYFADLVIFNENTLIDKATFKEPHQYPEGIEYVIVNGQVVIDRAEHTGNLPGKILRRQA
ncbi:MAG: D-aminoacylase [Candidatus Aminicenantes bacterium]|nr:D-aminoacylase [Candidatus Aminicenantes bacterium]